MGSGVFRYGPGILQWKSGELKYVDRKSRKIMTMYGALHMNSDVDRLCLKRKGGRGLTSVEHCVRERKIVWVFMLPNLKKTSSRELLQLR